MLRIERCTCGMGRLLYRGTEGQGGLCGYNPTVSGSEFRLAADMTIGGRRDSYSSENTVVVN